MMEPYLLGNEPIKTYLTRAVASEQLHHTILMSGPDGVGKALFAKWLSCLLLNAPWERLEKENHPDLHLLRPEGKSGTHLVEQLREMIEEVHRPPFEAKRKVFIIHEAERMIPAAANMLLKTLEEPDLDCQILLLSSAPNEILPTILSRCIHLMFQPIPKDLIAHYLQEKYSIPEPRAQLLSRLSNGSLGHALSLYQNDRSEKMERTLLDALENKISSIQAIEQIDALMNDLEGVDFHRQAEQLFAIYLMWARDQEVFRSSANKQLLYVASAHSQSTRTLSDAESRVARAKMALERNVKFSACLDAIL